MRKKSLYSTSDFKKDSLPTNRKELFWDILKNHYFSFLKTGLILVLFCLPLLFIGFIKDYSYIYANENGISNEATLITASAVEIIFVILLSIFASGMGKIYKEYSWMDPVFFKDDFKIGVKENIKPTIISAIFIALLNFFFNFVYVVSDNGFITAIPFGFNTVVLFPIFLHVIFINFLYTNKYGTNFSLGCFFYLKHLPSTLLLTMLIILPKAFDFFHFANIFTILTKYIIIAIYIIFIIPLILLIAQLNEMRIFDKRVNVIRFPEMVNKGLYIPEKKTDSSKNDTL